MLANNLYTYKQIIWKQLLNVIQNNHIVLKGKRFCTVIISENAHGIPEYFDFTNSHTCKNYRHVPSKLTSHICPTAKQFLSNPLLTVLLQCFLFSQLLSD